MAYLPSPKRIRRLANLMNNGDGHLAMPDVRDDSLNGSEPVPVLQQAARLPTRGGERLTLEDAKSLAMRLNPVLQQSLAAVGVAAGNEEIAYSGFLPTVQGSYSYQAFTSQTGFAGTQQGGRFPVLPVRGFGPGRRIST
jgi:outer membrane protein TolC